jgi:4-hydroxybenzoate polyprenyltransferase
VIAALRQQLPHYIQLTRLDRPVGIYLLLWPTLWALWVAAKGIPSLGNLLIFTLGVILMRSAGCVINDYADRHFDGHVERTRERPMARGVVDETEALLLFAILCLIAFILVCFTNLATILLSGVGVLLAGIYPFMKRFTFFPQVVLGAAFAWAIPMAYTAELGELQRSAWLLYLATLVWTVAYDTQYAMVDREDDLKIGVKSTAILLGDMDTKAIGLMQVAVLGILLLLGAQENLRWPYFLSLAVAAGLFAYQQRLIRDRDRQRCFKAFLNNQWVGVSVFAGLSANYLI